MHDTNDIKIASQCQAMSSEGVILERLLNANVPVPNLIQILQQEAPLEIGIRMQQRAINLRVRQSLLILRSLDLATMRLLEYPIARNVVALPADVVLDCSQGFLVVDAEGLEQRDQILGTVCSVGAAVVLASAGERFGEQFLAGVGRVASAAAVGVSPYVAVGVSDVV